MEKQESKSPMRKWVILAATIIIVVIGAFMLKPEVCGDCEDDLGQIVRPGFPNADAIPVHRSFREGKHTLTGVLSLPDPCYDVEHDLLIRESDPEQVEINLTTPRRGESCATVLTDKSFEVAFEAGADAEISATLNGDPVELLETGKG